MKYIEALIGLAVAVVTLLTALIGFKVKKRDAQVRQHRASVVSIDDPTVKATYSDVRRLKRWVVAGLVGFWLTTILGGTIAARDIEFLLLLSGAAILSVSVSLVVISFYKTEPPSRTMKSARIILAVGTKQAMESALAAVEDIGAEVARLDSEHGIIEARVPLSLLRIGALIKIEVSKKSGRQSEIMMSSDATSPSMMFDFGSNGHNLRRLKAFIARSSRENT